MVVVVIKVDWDTDKKIDSFGSYEEALSICREMNEMVFEVD